jgi:hypothetical protein
MLVHCKTVVDYAALPTEVLCGPHTLYKRGWDSEKKVAFFRPESGGAPY